MVEIPDKEYQKPQARLKEQEGTIATIVQGQDITERKRMEEQLNEKMNELKIINDAAVGRELNMIELEKEVNELLVELGRKPKYK